MRQVWDQEEETEQLEEDDSFFRIDYRRKIRNYFYEVWDQLQKNILTRALM